MLEEDYCSYEVAKLFKEKGFDEPCIRHWDCDDHSLYGYNDIPISNSELQANEYNGYAAPTLQMAMKWLRKVHMQHIQISYFHGAYREYEYVVINTFNGKAYHEPVSFSSYEEAVEAALKYSLENLI